MGSTLIFLFFSVEIVQSGKTNADTFIGYTYNPAAIVNLVVNGFSVHVAVDEKRSLLSINRREYHVSSAPRVLEPTTGVIIVPAIHRPILYNNSTRRIKERSQVKIKHAIKLKTSPARLAKLLQPSSVFSLGDIDFQENN